MAITGDGSTRVKKSDLIFFHISLRQKERERKLGNIGSRLIIIIIIINSHLTIIAKSHSLGIINNKNRVTRFVPDFGLGLLLLDAKARPLLHLFSFMHSVLNHERKKERKSNLKNFKISNEEAKIKR